MHFLVPFHYAILGMQFMEVSTPHTTYDDALYTSMHDVGFHHDV